MKKITQLLISLIIFLGTLESLSWLLLVVGIKAPYPETGYLISTMAEVKSRSRDSDRIGKIARIFLEWKKSHQELDLSSDVDKDLRNEPGRYNIAGINNKKDLFSRYDELAKNIDDDFILFGKNTGRVKHKARYKTDEFGRRVTGLEKVPNPLMNLIFIGCSYTFGEGVSAEESLPTLTGRLMKDVRVYNLASPGSSLAGRLALLLKKPNLLDGIDPSIPTVIIYVFLDDHLRRMAGTSELFKRGDFHYYESPWFSVKNNELVLNWGYDKDFWSFRWLIQMYAKTNFSRLTKLELPPISTKHYEMQGKILERLHLEVSKKLPKTVHTFVATFPGENHRIQEISPYLKDATLLDYSGFDFQNLLPHAQFYLAGDYHPHPRVYELFSMLLANDLNNQL